MTDLSIQPITADGFSPYGWMLGKATPTDPSNTFFSNAATDFWHEHHFDAGEAGQTEVLWVNYRSTGAIVQLEKHLFTQQAIVPLTGSIIHVVARSDSSGNPDLASLAAFAVLPGQGLCMAPGCWHATRVTAAEVTCLMLTRASTTRDLIAHLNNGEAIQESAFCAVPSITVQPSDASLGTFL